MMIRLLASILLLSFTPLMAGEIRIAVASNFGPAIEQLSNRFEQQTGHQVKISLGSTGKHYAQIKNGAPFDAFFAADSLRPELLEQQAIALPGSRFTYAQGKLVLWSPQQGLVDNEGLILRQGDFSFVALANPRLAPYGKAAQQVLMQRGLWDSLSKKMVRGENIGQAYQFVKTGNAQLGFVALSQIQTTDGRLPGSYWIVPQQYYSPIYQQAVLLRESALAREFLAFIKTPEMRILIQDLGYETP